MCYQIVMNHTDFRVTKEHREMLSKNAKTLFIKCRDHIKDIQNKFNKTVKQKEKDGLSQDVSKRITEQVKHYQWNKCNYNFITFF